MIRLSTIVGLLVLLFLPANAFAFWFGTDGQCFEPMAIPMLGQDFSAELAEEEPDCSSVDDATDPSSNVCFEAAGNPISTLPELIAENQAERVVAALLEKSSELVVVHAPLPSPNEASVEDPLAPGVPLIARPDIARPKSEPNACSVYPEDCERAPYIPTLNLDASMPQADSSAHAFEIPLLPDPETRRGPPAQGVGPAIGIVERLDRPPQVG